MCPEIASENLTEYYWSGNPNDCALHTLELRHPAFRDENDVNVPVRIVCDFDELVAMLEADAPVNGGEEVTFKTCAFTVKLPDQGNTGSPYANINIDNVSRMLMPYVLAAAGSPSPVNVTYRQYLASDLTQPGLVMDGAKIKKLKVTGMRVTAQAGYDDFINCPAPNLIYTAQEFPGLDR